jgi:hypothetical protein
MMALAALICGLIFGLGLMISGMLDPIKVLGFLDVFGQWDPTLAFVMAGALAVAALGYRLAQRRARPLFAGAMTWPNKTAIDPPLLAGAALFGAGWGLVGLCPGPALENLATLSPRVIVFVAAMGLGMVAHDFWQRRREWVARRDRELALAGPDG